MGNTGIGKALARGMNKQLEGVQMQSTKALIRMALSGKSLSGWMMRILQIKDPEHLLPFRKILVIPQLEYVMYRSLIFN